MSARQSFTLWRALLVEGLSVKDSTLVDWREAGRKADATRVMRLVGAGYDSWNRRSVHAAVVKSLVAAKPTKVIDLCAGGGSLRMLSAAGLAVLTVDDGRDDRLAANRITRDRYRRAMEITAAELGQEAAWGKVEKHVDRADAAFFDFLGQWSKENRRILEASRHMKAIAVTLMMDRMELGARGKMTDQDWVDAYIGLVERTTWMRVRWWRVYRRNKYQQKALVLFLRPSTRSGLAGACGRCGANRPPASRLCPTCKAKSAQPRKPLPYMPTAADRKRYLNRESYARHRETWHRYYAEHADEIRAYSRTRQREQRAAARREAICVICEETFLTPYRRTITCGKQCRMEAARRREREKRQVRLAAVSGTAAEAIKLREAA